MDRGEGGATHQTMKKTPNHGSNPGNPPIRHPSYQKGHPFIPKNGPQALIPRQQNAPPDPYPKPAA